MCVLGVQEGQGIHQQGGPGDSQSGAELYRQYSAARSPAHGEGSDSTHTGMGLNETRTECIPAWAGTRERLEPNAEKQALG